SRSPACSGCRSSGRSPCSGSDGSRCVRAHRSWWCRVVEGVVLWRRLIGAQVRSQLQYRLSFVLDLVGAFLISFIDFLAVVVIFSSVWVVGACLAFWTTDGGEFTNAFTYGGNFLAQYPVDILSAWLRRFLAYIVPLAFVAYFPALYILDKPDPLGLPRFLEFASPLVALLAAAVAGLVWRFAVR